MPNKGDTFTVILKSVHLGWGTKRYTGSRDSIAGEGYIPIPSEFARNHDVYNSNYGQTGIGVNEFNAKSIDGYFTGVLKTSGGSRAGDIHAKNLHGSGDLKALGRWFYQVNMQPGDQVRVEWISSTSLTLEKV